MRRLLPLLPLLLLVGCGQPKTKTPVTQGLPASTNVWAQVSTTLTSPETNKANEELIAVITAAMESDASARDNLKKFREALGAIKDAGLGDVLGGDLKSLTLGATLPKNAALLSPSPADLQLVVILRGNFNPTRLAEFAKNSGLKQTEIGGAPTWGLVELACKIIKEPAQPDPFGLGVTAVDEHTLVIAAPTVLSHAVAALQGKEASLIAPKLKVLEGFQDWQALVVFSDRDLIDAQALKEARGRDAANIREFLRILPHDHIALISGQRGDQSVGALYGIDAQTQESISYGGSLSTTLAPKIAGAIGKMLKQTMDEQKAGK
ncbi:hypothetical protein EBR16_03090 [bacterium]|jgi:hypothetical protein|nr:hypothetical protein [bacterium]